MGKKVLPNPPAVIGGNITVRVSTRDAAAAAPCMLGAVLRASDMQPAVPAGCCPPPLCCPTGAFTCAHRRTHPKQAVPWGASSKPACPSPLPSTPSSLQALLKNGKTGGVFITLPYLSLRCEQMWPTKPQHAGFPNWFDCYFTVLQPLPQPTGGLLGSTYRPPPVGAAAVAAKQPAASAAFVFEEN